jgi:glycosyltransferase involved in cell wall biosynthesis
MQIQSRKTAIRILHIFGCMNRGGAEMRTLDLMRRIDREQFQMDFCSLSGNRGLLDADIRKLGGEVHYCKLRSLSFNPRFKKLLRDGQYDVVHSHVHYFSGYILWLAKRCGIPKRIAHFRNTTDTQSKSLKRRIQTSLMRRMIHKYATHILSVGEGAMQVGWRPDWQNDPRCTVIYNGLDTRPFYRQVHSGEMRANLQVPPDAPLLIHVGRMAKQKNHFRLAHIAARILSHKPSAHFLLIGRENNDTKEQMTSIFADANVADRVHFLGVRDDVPQLLAISDLMLFPSLWEGLPGAVLEACAAGTPVLASDIPGVRELTGVFSVIKTLPLDDSDDAWAAAACSILNNPPTAHYRAKSLTKIENSHFHIEPCVKEHERVWADTKP